MARPLMSPTKMPWYATLYLQDVHGVALGIIRKYMIVCTPNRVLGGLYRDLLIPTRILVRPHEYVHDDLPTSLTS